MPKLNLFNVCSTNKDEKCAKNNTNTRFREENSSSNMILDFTDGPLNTFSTHKSYMHMILNF